jgi:hypothetical protein
MRRKRMPRATSPAHEFTYTCNSVRAVIHAHGGADYPYLEGYVETPEGLVCVYSQIDAATMRMYFGGLMYARMENRGYSKRGLAIAAGKFARRVWMGKIG